MATLVETPDDHDGPGPEVAQQGRDVGAVHRRQPPDAGGEHVAVGGLDPVHELGALAPRASCVLGPFAAPWNRGALVLAPRRSARVAAMQCRIPHPAARPVATSRPTFSTRPVAFADSASAGSRLRSPITPFWHSWVSTTVLAGATSSDSCMADTVVRGRARAAGWRRRAVVVVGRVLHHRDHPGLHEPGGAHDLAGAGDLGDLDHARDRWSSRPAARRGSPRSRRYGSPPRPVPRRPRPGHPSRAT